MFIYITNQFQTNFFDHGGGVKPLVELTVNSEEEALLSQLCLRIRPLESRL
jgi:hypothetical protein